MENIEEILNTALDDINNQDFIKAKELLIKVVEKDKNNIEAYKNLGLCEVKLDNPIDAIMAFRQVLEIDKENTLSMFYLASCLSRIGEKEEAIEYFKQVIALRPEFLDAYKNLSMIFIEYAQYEDAIELLNKVISNTNLEPDYSILYILATCHMLKKDYNNAINYLVRAIALEPNNVQMLNSLSVCYINCGKYSQALEILNNLLEIDKENSMVPYNIANCFLSLEDYKNALKYFQMSYQMEPSIVMLASLANCALQARQFELACNLYQNLVMTYPHNVEYRISYVNALEGVQNYKDALENTKYLLQTDPKNITYIKKKGACLRKLGFHQESIATFEQLLKRGKIDVEVYYNLAFSYIELNDFDNAKEMLKKCIVLEPQNPYAHKDLGVLYLKMNCYEWAVDEMLQAIELEDDIAEFYYSLGVAYMMLSDIEAAKNAFDDALKYDENDANTLAYYGYIYIMERHYEQAYAYLEKAIKLEPNNFIAVVNMAKYYFANEKWETAKQFLLDSIEISQDDESLNMLGICNLKLGLYDEALGFFYNLSEKYPKNHIVLTDLAKCEFECGKIESAKEHIRQALLVFNDYQPALDLLKEMNYAK